MSPTKEIPETCHQSPSSRDPSPRRMRVTARMSTAQPKSPQFKHNKGRQEAPKDVSKDSETTVSVIIDLMMLFYQCLISHFVTIHYSIVLYNITHLNASEVSTHTC